MIRVIGMVTLFLLTLLSYFPIKTEIHKIAENSNLANNAF